MQDVIPLLEKLAITEGPVCWVADENQSTVPAALAEARERVTYVSNRYDLATVAQQLGIRSYFSDFDLSACCSTPPTSIFYRVSKERAVVNHIINHAFRVLSPGGKLWLAGQKNEGIKNYFPQTTKLFGSNDTLQKNGNHYLGSVTKHDTVGELLDDRDYPRLRWIEPKGHEAFLSKPGTYGWDKVDAGSAFLKEHLRAHLGEASAQDKHFLDLGCGYGYLTLQCRDAGFATMTATDNNAAAILCIQGNAEAFKIPVRVLADDCGSSLNVGYDIIACNPPFHRGFDVASTLTDKFLGQSWRLLNKGGRAFFVVNSFIPLETKAKSYFGGGVQVLANNRQFKVVQLQKP